MLYIYKTNFAHTYYRKMAKVQSVAGDSEALHDEKKW